MFSSIASFFGGGIIGVLLGFYLDIWRERRTRKNDLLAYLSVWSSEVTANRKTVNASNVAQTIADRFDESRLKLLGQATVIETDFRGDERTQFKRLADAIANMTPGSVGDEEGRQKLLEAISSLADFLKKN